MSKKLNDDSIKYIDETFEEKIERVFNKYQQMHISEEYVELWEAFKMIVEDMKEFQEMDEAMDETIGILKDSGLEEEEILDILLRASVDEDFLKGFDILEDVEVTDEMLEIAMSTDDQHPERAEEELCKLGLTLEEARALISEVSMMLDDTDVMGNQLMN